MKGQNQSAVTDLSPALPACAVDCIWYEADDSHLTCLNRKSFICHKHCCEVFGDKENEDQDIP